MFRLSEILVSAPWRRLVLVGGGVALLAACGQKGNLYLPSQPSATLPQVLQLTSPARAAASAAAPAASAAATVTPAATTTAPTSSTAPASGAR